MGNRARVRGFLTAPLCHRHNRLGLDNQPALSYSLLLKDHLPETSIRTADYSYQAGTNSEGYP